MTRIHYVLSLCVLSLAACEHGDPSAPDDSFAAVDAAARAAFESQAIDGMGLAIYDSAGTKVFEQMYGDFAPDRRVAIASASKLVSGVTLFRLIDQGYLTLDSTTGEVLGWSGDNAAVTLRHLLSFTSGLAPEHGCTYRPDISLAQCVELIAALPLEAAPGTRFDYGSTHLAVAGRMAEVVTGRAWNDVFAAQTLDLLDLPADLYYYANPLAETGQGNPLLAGGLKVSMNDYEPILRFVFDKGVWLGSSRVAPSLFDAQAIAPFPEAEIGRTPARPASLRYGLTAWLECSTPATGCDTLSSPGAFGFVPWLDRAKGYYAILGMQVPNDVARGFAVALHQELRPLIEQALPHR
jgi:CubicO group peptidase (beta-lactamase class C family)